MVNKAMNSDLGQASSFPLTQKSRPFTQTGYGGVMFSGSNVLCLIA